METIVIGAGQAGLAMSYCLGRHGVEHVVLERGRIAESWRRQRWDSLRLLTPNWQSRLPGFAYQWSEPDGYMRAEEVVRYFDAYATAYGAPVEESTAVLSARRFGGGYLVETSRGECFARTLIITTGHCHQALVPPMSRDLAGDIAQESVTTYRNPDQLARSGVLVVGASASGIQIAEEVHLSGRPVTLAVGRHTRLPRRYRGRDIMWWMDRTGILHERAEDVPDLDAARRQPSLQLAGNPDGQSLDLARLRDIGVELVGRLEGLAGARATFVDDLEETTGRADAKLRRLLARIEEHVTRDPASAAAPARPIAPFIATGATELDLAAAGIGTVIWATGYRREYPWLHLPILDGRGEVRHHGGQTPARGVYVLGLRFLRHRNSNFIGGVGRDAAAIADRVLADLARRPLAA